MPMAGYAGAAVVLVADIDRGGVFASAYGSIMLQPERFRPLIKGIIVKRSGATCGCLTVDAVCLRSVAEFRW